ncbi:MAG TPA: MG2 domain-containing protein [Telluria sp.]|nr:MG2 domain-containing protein [Telluria sp.]
MHVARGVLSISLVLSALAHAQPASQAGATVEAFSPTGEAKQARQVTARFSEPMVAFGDPRLESPFDIRCDAKGHGHWADGRNWVYDFDADLPGGLACDFRTRAGLKAMSGAAVTAARFHFSTGGPAIVVGSPREGMENIDEDQVFLLGLDAVVDIASVREHAYCSIKGLGERVPLQIIGGKERERILAEQKGEARNFFLVLTKRARVGLLAVKDKRLDAAPLVVVARCGRKLAAGGELGIVWGKGIRAPSGVATDSDQTLNFGVRPNFSAKAECQRLKPNAGCIPVMPISLVFTAPVDAATAAAIELRGADGKVVRPTLDPKEKTVGVVSFNGPFAARSDVTLTMPAGFHDDAGRALVNGASFPMKIRIDDDPPLIKFPSHFGILEANAQPVLPVSVRNVEQSLKGLQAKVAGPASNGKGQLANIDTSSDRTIAKWINKVLVAPHEAGDDERAFEAKNARPAREGDIPILLGKDAADAKATALTLPRAAGPHTLELMGIPLPAPGFYVVEFASERLGQSLLSGGKPYYAYSSALVTNMAVHFKLGRESSLAWVTQLDNAKPVGNAQVSVASCDGEPLWSGTTGADGVVRIFATLPEHYYRNDCNGLQVVARKGQDMSFALTRWNDGIEPWQFNLGGGNTARPQIAHTVFDRPLFRAGETVSMKHFVRRRTGAGFEAGGMPGSATLKHNGSGQSYTVPIQWHAGAGVSEWTIPKEAKLGSYTVTLATDDGPYESGSFRVEQYRVPLMKAVLKGPAKPLIRATQVDIDAQLSYLSGGAAAGAPVKFRSRLVASPLSFPEYDDFHFGGKAPKEGVEAVAPYSYDPEGDSDNGEESSAADVPAGVAGYPVRTRSMMLDASGGARVNFAGVPKGDEPRALEVEMEYTDPNGQILTASTRALVLPSALVLGMRVDGGYATKERMSFKVLALDPRGKIQAGRKVSVDAYQRKTYAYRKRLLGGFYAYEQTAEVKRLGEVCSGKTDAHGFLLCEGESPATGELVLVANAKDGEGNLAQSSSDIYVADADNWYAASPNDRIDVLPEKRNYKPGETARFEVRMPFRDATALVTVEREGVLDSKVVSISAKSPFVEVPVLQGYGPNTYVSVMVVRGRIDPESPGRFFWLRRLVNRIGVFFGLAKKLPPEIDTHPTALVDLTKPAFKLGIARIRVGWDAYELKVKVEPEKPVYKIRDRAVVKIHVTDAAGKPAANAEVALAAVDEGLLSLAASTSWNLLEAMMERRPEEVTTSTAQSQVIGKRHFGKKSAAPGGGGGGEGANARELFDTLLLWKPVVQLDANGDARVEVPLNDSLTAFRIAAIAHAGDIQFGTATATIRTTQEVMLFAGLPPFVREGDQFAAMVTVRNGGERPLTLDVTAAMADKPAGKQRVSLKAGEASTLSFTASVPFDAPKLNWDISATEVGAAAPAHDALKFVQTVGAAYPVRLYQQTLEQLEPGKARSFPVQKPAGALPGRGGVDVRLVNSLGGETGGLREWMTRYPYVCIEQRASVAVALEDRARWVNVMNSLPSYLDGDGLARYFPMGWLEGDDTLTAYLLTIADEAGYEIPESTRNRMLRGLENFVAGRIHRYGSLQTADVVMRKLAAIDALARYGQAKPAMLESLEIAPNLWPSSGVIDWISVLTRLNGVPERERKLAEAQQILRSRLMFSGTTLSFSTEKNDYLWWLMVSPDVNAVRALRLLVDDPAFPAADAGRLARGALGRQAGGRWSTTVANAWGVVALRHFKERYERDPVSGVSNVKLGDQDRPLAWNAALAGATGDPTLGTPMGDGVAAHFAWPAAPASLTLQHQGGGKPWAFVASRAALPLDKPLFSGYRITRTVTPVEQKKSGAWQVGDTYRVTLEVDAQSDRTWVVLNDPVPAGASILGSGLGGDSAQLTAGDKKLGWQRPAFEERAFDGFRAYYRYVPKGKFTVEYTVRLNNAGRFEMPATRVEAMYAPEVFGEIPVVKMDVIAAGK